MRPIVAITCTFNGRKSYVTSCFNRFDKTIAVELVTDPGKAKDFNTIGEARKICPNIYNPYERKYVVEQIEVNQSQAFIISKTQSWLEERVLR
jgi:hypothetical protein